ncbi:MAG: endo-1,4-beta-xylanase [Bacteroidota bacterium]
MLTVDGGIGKNRTARAEINVLNADRTPCAGQELTIEQTRHQFLFGTAGFDLALANGELAGEEKERAEERAAKLATLFNFVTLPFYWGRFEPRPGRPLTERLMKAAGWCVDRGLRVKGHPLCWHTVTADWLLTMSNREILAAQIGRIRREVADFRGAIDMWDVVNEAVIMPVFDRYDNGVTRLCKELGRIWTVKAMFEAARDANPDAVLLLNDFDTSSAYEILIEGCLEAGIRIDAIGIQSHMHQGYWGVEKTLRILERFARFNLPLHFTETTIVSGNLMPPEIVDLNDYRVDEWPTTPAGEERQAREVVQHYRTLFAHPAVEAITWWVFSDGGWLGAPAGLVRRDGSSKPAYEELRRLIRGEWWTGPVRTATDGEGRVRFTGFLGEYELTCRGQKRSFALDRQGTATIEILL